jgi:hypothetical protein
MSYLLTSITLLNKYQSKFNVNNIIELDISKIINELDDDINIIKMFYLDAIIFIKQKIKLLSGYPENYEQIVQTIDDSKGWIKK